MTKVAFICQWYPPEPVGVPESIARNLDGDELAVSVLTGIPNFPSGIVHEGYRALGRVRELINGIPVLRTPLYASHDANAVRRFLNYGSWAASSTILGQRLIRRSEVALVYSSPATAAAAAMAGRRFWGTPYVLLIQDLWPDSVFASGFLSGRAGRLAGAVLNRFVDISYRWAAHVVVISPGMADLLISRGVPREKISVVHNWLPESGETDAAHVATTTLRERFGIPGRERVFLYAGNHGRAQGLETLVAAFQDARTAPGHLILLGVGVCKKDLVRQSGQHPRIHFHDRVDRAEAMRLVASADVHVVSLADQPLFAVTMPSKVQSGLAAGQPMLVVSRGDAANVVNESGAGRSAVPGDVDAVVHAVADLLSVDDAQLVTMGERGRAIYASKMAPEVGVPRLRAVLKDAAATGRRAGTRKAAKRLMERNAQ